MVRIPGDALALSPIQPIQTEIKDCSCRCSVIWWESVVMLRKLSFAIFAVFFGTSDMIGVQLLLVTMVLMTSLALHLLVRPYKDNRMNHLETMGLVVGCDSCCP